MPSEGKHKAAEADRLLNDPEIPFDPAKVWALMEELAQATPDPVHSALCTGSAAPSAAPIPPQPLHKNGN